jgi:predicted Na+-dependent transporter
VPLASEEVAAMSRARFIVNKLMAGWLILFAILGLLEPRPFTVLSPWVNYLLGGVIFITGYSTARQGGSPPSRRTALHLAWPARADPDAAGGESMPLERH